MRAAFAQVGNLGTEAPQDHPVSAVAVEQRPARVRAGGARLQHAVAVHRRRPGDLDHRPFAVPGDGDIVRGGCPAGALQHAAHRHAQPQRAFGVEGELRLLVRLQPAGGRIAVPRGDGRGHGEPHEIAVPAQQQPVAEVYGRRLARGQVADARGVQPRLRLLQEHRRVAVGDGVLVAPLRLRLGDDRAGHRAVADLHRETEQDGVHRQRKRVDRLDVPGAGIAVVLAHVEYGHEIVDGGVDADLLQHHLSLSALQRRGHGRSHLSASSLRVCSTSDAARRTIDRTASAPRPASCGSITSSTPGASVTWVRNVTSPGRRARGGGR